MVNILIGCGVAVTFNGLSNFLLPWICVQIFTRFIFNGLSDFLLPWICVQLSTHFKINVLHAWLMLGYEEQIMAHVLICGIYGTRLKFNKLLMNSWKDILMNFWKDITMNERSINEFMGRYIAHIYVNEFPTNVYMNTFLHTHSYARSLSDIIGNGLVSRDSIYYAMPQANSLLPLANWYWCSGIYFWNGIGIE